MQLGYDPHNAPWSAYGFVQDTLEKSDTREDNNRYGMGGSYLVSERLKLDGEISDGDIGGIGGKLGTSYLQSERTTIYLNYVLEDERIESAFGLDARQRGQSGDRREDPRLSDSSSVYAEERYRHGNSLTGLTHAAGVNLAPTQSFTLSATTDIGTLQRPADRREDGSRRRRRPRRLRRSTSLQLSTGIEYRDDKQERIDSIGNDAEDVVVSKQFPLADEAVVAIARQVELLDQQQFAGRLLQRRIHRRRARVCVSAGRATTD